VIDREGIFFYRKDGWTEVNNWPKGRTRAKLVADCAPFGDYSLAEARAKVSEFIAAESLKSHGYESFGIIPMEREPMSEETKIALRAAARAKREPAKETEEEVDMARADGRVKCKTKGCKNYVTPPTEKCQPCRDKFLDAALAIAREVRTEDSAPAAIAREKEDIASGALPDLNDPASYPDGVVPPDSTPATAVTSQVVAVPASSKVAYDKAQVIALFESGKEIPEVAAALGLTAEQVRYAVKKTEAYKQRKARKA